MINCNICRPIQSCKGHNVRKCTNFIKVPKLSKQFPTTIFEELVKKDPQSIITLLTTHNLQVQKSELPPYFNLIER